MLAQYKQCVLDSIAEKGGTTLEIILDLDIQESLSQAAQLWFLRGRQ